MKLQTLHTINLRNHWQVGIARLLSKGTYSAAYPLHDGRYDKDGPNGEQCARRVNEYLKFSVVIKEVNISNNLLLKS